MIVALARAVLGAVLPPDARAAVLRDLDEEYALRGGWAGTVWYCRQVLGSLRPALDMRRRRGRRLASSTRSPASLHDGLWQDVRFASRLISRHKAFTLGVVLTFSIGLGATTAIFSVVDRVLIRPLPYDQPSRLVRIWSANPRGIARNSMSPADFFDLADQARSVAALAAFAPTDALTVNIHAEPFRVLGTETTANLAGVLGVTPLAGRWLGPDDTRGDGAAVVILSEGLWRERFASDAGVLGRSVSIDGTPRTIVGIMPRTFEFPSRDERVWLPLPESWRTQPRSAHFLGVVGRLTDGSTIDTARQALGTIARRLESSYPATNRGWGITVTSLRQSLVGHVETPLLLLMAAVASVLVIAAANVASLLLARGFVRSGEMALCAALGAAPGRILRTQIIETLMLAVAGAAGGLLLAAWGLQSFRSLGGSEIPMLEHAALDARALIAAGTVTIVAALIAGLLPAWNASRVQSAVLLQPGTRSTGRPRARQIIVCAQVAVATALVVAGTLLVRSFLRLTSVDSGFQGARALLADVSLPARYDKGSRAAFFARALERIRSLPGVDAAGAGGPLPLSGQDGLLRFGLLVDGRAVPPDLPDRAYLRWATPEYFSAMGIPIRDGRAFLESDIASSTPVAIVDDVVVRRFFDGSSPIGQRVRTSTERTWRQVVGVVGGVHQISLDRDREPHVYVPEAQMPSPSLTFVIRGSLDAGTLAAGIRETVRAIDPEQPVSNVRTLEDLVAGSVASRRFSTWLLTLFAVLAMILTAVGVFGVVSQSVAQATREIGVRVALGASPHAVLVRVLGQSLRVTIAGILAGAALAWIAGPSLAGLLFGVEPRDSIALVTAALLLLAVATLAAYLPARRALRIDVVHALRAD